MEPVILLFACMLAVIAILRTPRISAPQLVAPVTLWTPPPKDDEDEQKPERRSPMVPRTLMWAVGSAAVLRAVAFVALGS